MKVIALQGSPRKKGNTAKVLAWVEEALITNGHEVETIYLTEKTVKGCLACGKCKEIPDAVGCVQKDDGLEILEKMTQADVCIFASPLYFWGVSSQLKSVIDRTYSLYVDAHQPGHASLVDGQRQALLMTGAGPKENNAEGAITAFGRMQAYHKAINAGELFIGKCTTPADMDISIKEQAVAFAKKITG